MKELQGTPSQSHRENQYSMKMSPKRKEGRDGTGTFLFHDSALFLTGDFPTHRCKWVERTKSPLVSLDEDYKEHGTDSSHPCLGEDERQQIQSPSAKFQSILRSYLMMREVKPGEAREMVVSPSMEVIKLNHTRHQTGWSNVEAICLLSRVKVWSGDFKSLSIYSDLFK